MIQSINNMQAFHNDTKIKNKYLTRIQMHKAADEIIKGTYWQGGKGCAVGCTIHSGDHANYETELGIPRILARLEDRLFENLPNEIAKEWPEKFLSSINVGADLSMVWPKFAHWLLVDKDHGVIKYAKKERTIKSINDVAALYFRTINNENIEVTQWRAAAAAAAYDAAADAAYDDAAAAAAAAYAAYAAYDAAAAAYAAYDDAAAAAAAAYAAYDDAAAARRRSYIVQSEKLLELLREAI